MQEIYQKIYETGIIPVIKIEDAANAVPLAKALIDGGLPAAEVTFRTAAAADAIKAMSEAFPEMLIGAGTVLTPEQADAAKNAGATFIVSPGLNPKVVEHCLAIGMPIVPGCANPSDIEVAIGFGLDTVKFFPAEAAGGLAMLKAMSAPYGGIKFMPTGGLNEKNICDYLAFDKVLACGGSFMVKDEYIRNKEFDKIKALTENAVKLMLGFKIKHIGINAANEEEARNIVDGFAAIGFAPKEGSSSFFLNTDIEVMKNPGRGRLGHIAIGTNSVRRAEAYLKAKGFTFDETSKKPDEKGNYKIVYLDKEIGGFAVHLVQN